MKFPASLFRRGCFYCFCSLVIQYLYSTIKYCESLLLKHITGKLKNKINNTVLGHKTKQITKETNWIELGAFFTVRYNISTHDVGNKWKSLFLTFLLLILIVEFGPYCYIEHFHIFSWKLHHLNFLDMIGS